MDFRTHQDSAKSKTWRLILFYAFLVLTFTLLASLGITAAWFGFFPETGLDFPVFAAIVFGLILCFILGLTAFSPTSFAAGGRGVAKAMHGALVPPQTTDLGERRLLNVVNEMALASGIPMPPVYILRNEKGINAFAAGCTPNDAVIGVTRGAVDHLDRDELQAVVAHEFSHILNGDMRLNLRFAQLIFGLTCLLQIGQFLGHSLRRTSRHSRDSGRIMGLIAVCALICYCTGLLTSFLGTLVQAAVNRQREYLADASSVQFTRSMALASALQKIGGLKEGSRLTETEMSRDYGHFFFSRTYKSLFSTHPPLRKRIRRIDPSWDGTFITSVPVKETLSTSGEKPSFTPAPQKKPAQAKARGSASPLGRAANSASIRSKKL